MNDEKYIDEKFLFILLFIAFKMPLNLDDTRQKLRDESRNSCTREGRYKEYNYKRAYVSYMCVCPLKYMECLFMQKVPEPVALYHNKEDTNVVNMIAYSSYIKQTIMSDFFMQYINFLFNLFCILCASEHCALCRRSIKCNLICGRIAVMYG